MRRSKAGRDSWASRSASAAASVENRTVKPAASAAWPTLSAIIVLPSPLPPLSRTFSARSTNSSSKSRSMSGRSIFSGWSQSKRSWVLQEPRQANRVRRARLTAIRDRSSRSASCSRVSVGPRWLLWTWVRNAASCAWSTRSPSRRSRSPRSLSLIVGLQVVRNDVGVVEVVGQDEREGHQAAQVLAVLLTGDGERADVGEAARDQVCGGGAEHLVAVEVEQLDGTRDAVTEARAGDVPALDDAVERRNHGADAIAALEVACGAALVEEGYPMLGVLEDLPAAP